MATSLGRVALLAVSTDGGSTYTTVERVVDLTFDQNADEEEYTSHDDGGDRQFGPGHRDRELSGSLIYDQGQTGQDALNTSMTGGNIYYFRFRPSTGSGLDQLIAQGFVTSYSQGAPLEGYQTRDFSIRITGAVTESSQ